MPRPQRCRKVCSEPEYSMFYPAGFASGDTVTLTVDEYEVIRLVDLEKLTHSQAAELMEISRTTATEIYNIAREKIVPQFGRHEVPQPRGLAQPLPAGQQHSDTFFHDILPFSKR